jgi:hypothetical protein
VHHVVYLGIQLSSKSELSCLDARENGKDRGIITSAALATINAVTPVQAYAQARVNEQGVDVMCVDAYQACTQALQGTPEFSGRKPKNLARTLPT